MVPEAAAASRLAAARRGVHPVAPKVRSLAKAGELALALEALEPCTSAAGALHPHMLLPA